MMYKRFILASINFNVYKLQPKSQNIRCTNDTRSRYVSRYQGVSMITRIISSAIVSGKAIGPRLSEVRKASGR